MSKEALKKLKQERRRSRQGLTKYIINGKEDRGPYYKYGYNEKGKYPDPNSGRSERKGKGKGGDVQKANVRTGLAMRPQTRYREFPLTHL